MAKALSDSLVDAAFGDEIVKKFGLLSERELRPGLQITLPQYIPNINKADNVNNYQTFLSTIQGSILPYIPTPFAPPKPPGERVDNE